MTKPTVFISHSTNGKASELAAGSVARAQLERAQEVRSAVVDRLQDAFDPWLDGERNEANMMWRLEIFAALYRCAAAVILLDDNGFASDWVVQEATILNFRRRITPGFVLVPVLIDGGSSSRFDADARWKPLGLREIQALKPAPGDVQALEASPGEIADAVAALLAPVGELAPDPDTERWADDLAAKLRPIARDNPGRLTGASQVLKMNVPWQEWTVDDGAPVRHLAHALLSAAPELVAEVAIDHLGGGALAKQERCEVSRLLGPLWVDLPAAALVAGGLRGERRVVINTGTQAVAENYLTRAARRVDVKAIWDPPVWGEGGVAELFVQLERAVNDAFVGAAGNDAAAFEAYSTSSFGRLDRRVLMVPIDHLAPAEARQLLDRLAARFPGLPLMALGGPSPPDVGELVPPPIVVVEPLLTAEREQYAGGYRRALAVFEEG